MTRSTKPKQRDLGVVIFDGDDTLWKTQELYEKAKIQYLDILKKLGIIDANLIRNLDSLDACRAGTLGFSRTRFMESMLLLYAQYCGAMQMDWDVLAESEIRKLSRILECPVELYPDAMDALRILASKYQLILFTKGDIEDQRKKIESLGAEFTSCFFQIHICMSKGPDELSELMAAFENRPVAVIGNSIRSDILPAMELGVYSILILRPSWHYEEVCSVPLGITTADSLSEVAELLKRRNSDEATR